MTKRTHIINLCVAAMCMALGCVIPMAFHAFGLGKMFLPMHIPVLICGLLTGPITGTACGLLTPLLSCLMTGMPAPVGLVSMVPELMVYGLVTGLIYRFVHTNHIVADIYIALFSAMVSGRIVCGIAEAIFYLAGNQTWTLATWATARFVTAAPGIVVHLLLIPALMLLLERTRLFPLRYPKN